MRREAAHLLTRWLLLRDHHYLWLVAGSSPTGLPSRLVLLRLLGELVNFENVIIKKTAFRTSIITPMTFVCLDLVVNTVNVNLEMTILREF